MIDKIIFISILGLLVISGCSSGNLANGEQKIVYASESLTLEKAKELLADESLSVRKATIDQLLRSKNQKSLPLLENFFVSREGDPARVDALFAYSMIGREGASEKVIGWYYDGNIEMKLKDNWFIRAFGMLGSREALQILRKMETTSQYGDDIHLAGLVSESIDRCVAVMKYREQMATGSDNMRGN